MNSGRVLIALACLLWVGFGPLARLPLEPHQQQNQLRIPAQTDQHPAVQAPTQLQPFSAPLTKTLTGALPSVTIPGLAPSLVCFQAQLPQTPSLLGSLQALSVRWQI